MSDQTTDPLERVMLGMKTYIDGQVAALRQEVDAALTSHVAAISELRDTIAGLQTEVTLGLAFDGEAYQRFVVAECARLGVKPSEIAKARAALDSEAGMGETEGNDADAEA